MRQKQAMTACGFISAWCYTPPDYSRDDVVQMMNEQAMEKYGACVENGHDVEPCLAMPTNRGGQDLLFATAYGTVDECSGGWGYSATAYRLHKTVECVDPGMDSDADCVPDCVDNCPLTHNPD